MTNTATDVHVDVQTRAGLVRGLWRPTTPRPASGTYSRSAAFLGIPFAEPPVGDLRFAAPVPHRPWDGVREALEYGATPQRGDDAAITLIPEPSVAGPSTLNVNVFTPSPGTDAGLPVLVYIHGGGFTSGSPASPWYDGGAFNRDGVVTVSVSYRLGFDGFGWIADAPANRGVLDWLLALQWVRDNIAAFGGDPERVTIAGQSAGGGAVLTLLGMPAAQHLFEQVYCISGATADVAPDRAERLGRRLAELAGVEPTRAGLATLSEERVIELQAKVAEPAEEGALGLMRSFLDDGLAFGPMVDGELIARPTLDAIRAGVGADKPLVLGTTDDEFSMVLKGAEKKLRFVPATFLFARMGVSKTVRRRYFAANRDVGRRGTAALVGRYITDRMFRTAALRIAEARGAASTWLYRFSWRSPDWGIALHCLDVPFLFDCLGAERIAYLAGPNPPQALADEVHAGGVAFVADGDPGWARFTPSTGATKVFDTPPSVMEHGYESVRPLMS